MIDDSRARKLASDLKRCSYYETCATYGLNVERVFQDGKFGKDQKYDVFFVRVKSNLFFAARFFRIYCEM